MTIGEPSLETKAERTMYQFMMLLNEIQQLGMKGFAKMLDEASGLELDGLMAACNSVRGQIAKHRTKVG